MKIKYALISGSLALFLSSCSSTQPTSFYLLNTIDTSNIEPQGSEYAPLTVLVNSIKFPDYLDRPQMVIRDSDYKFQLSEKHRWAEPLKNEFTRVFMENINNRISPSNAVIYSALNGIKPNINLSIEVLQLDVNTNNEAVLSVKWGLSTDSTAKLITNRVYQYTAAVNKKDYESKVAAQSRTVSLFSDHVAESILAVQTKQ